MAVTTPASDARDRRLVSVLSRARRGGRVSPEGWMITAGSALAVGGLALIVVGWVGTSRTVLVAGQIPYLVSGGLLGLGLVFLGGFLYFAYWLALLVRQGRDQAEQTVRLESGLAETAEALATIVKLLQEGAVPSNGATPARRRRSGAPALAGPLTMTARPDLLVATPTGTMAHRPDCPIVLGRSDVHEVSATGSRRCGICMPAD